MCLTRSLRRFCLGVTAILTLLSPAFATTYFPQGIESGLLVTDGKLVFVQPSGSVTILNASKGTVLLRTPPPHQEAGPYGLTSTAYGILVSSPIDFRMVDLRRDTLAWEFTGCEGGHHLGRDHLICIETQTVKGSPFVLYSAHHLADGKPRWTHRVKAEYDGGEILDGKGRLMISFEKQHERETLNLGEGRSLERPVRRVTGLTVLDLVTGRELLPRITLDVRLDGSASEPVTFDGDRIAFTVHRHPKDPCLGPRLHVLSLSASASSVSAQEVCDRPQAAAETSPPADPQARPDPAWATPWTSVEGPESPIALSEGSMTFTYLGYATLLEVKPQRGHWRAAIPHDDHGLRINRLSEQGGLLFVESLSWTVGRLDAFHLRSGQPLWTYVFLTTPRLASFSPLMGPAPPPAKGAPAEVWKAVSAKPPRGPVPIPTRAPEPTREQLYNERFDSPGPSRVLLDPQVP